MKIAVITDLHANRQAVEAVLDHARGDITHEPCVVMECIKGVSLRSRLDTDPVHPLQVPLTARLACVSVMEVARIGMDELADA